MSRKQENRLGRCNLEKTSEDSGQKGVSVRKSALCFVWPLLPYTAIPYDLRCNRWLTFLITPQDDIACAMLANTNLRQRLKTRQSLGEIDPLLKDNAQDAKLKRSGLLQRYVVIHNNVHHLDQRKQPKATRDHFGAGTGS